MNVLIIKNAAAEGPGTIEDHLKTKNIPYSVVEPYRRGPAPDVDRYSHVVIMGGPMAVYEMHVHAYLKDEAALIEKAVRTGKRVLGVCLGAQMLAHVLGAKVYPGGQKEIGWYEVSLTGEGMDDPCMVELSVDGRNAAQVFQWHGDTFDLPRGAVRLASSPLFPNQAFRFNDRVYALQFHIEVTPGIVREWLKDEQGIDFNAVSAESEKIFPPYLNKAGSFYRQFFDVSEGMP
ncbi:MAG: type 1 glutamine amidotransferase [Nitrospirota bacterium]